MTSPLINFLNISAVAQNKQAAFAGLFLRKNPNDWDLDLLNSYKSLGVANLKYIPDAQKLVTRNFELQIESSKTDSYVLPVHHIDNQHAVLLVREAPDTSSTDQGRVAETLSVKTASGGTGRPTIGAIKFATDNFLLQTISEENSERVVPSYTFRGAVVRTSSTFGRMPRIFGYDGLLVTTDLDTHAIARMMTGWDDYLRATSCVMDMRGSLKTRPTPYYVELLYHDQVRRGYLLSIQYSISSELENMASISFTMFVVDSFSRGGPIKASGDPK